MKKVIDVIDSAVFGADPMTVFQAVVAEAKGRASWWMPTLEMIPVSGKGEVGSTFDIRVWRTPTARFNAELIERLEGKLLRVRYTGGDFRGQGVWTFEPHPGGTLLRHHWHVRPNSFRTRVLGRFVDMGALHSKVMSEGFQGLHVYLADRAASAVGASGSPYIAPWVQSPGSTPP